MNYRLHTLLILMAILPAMLAGAYWAYEEWRMSMVHIEMSPGGDVLRIVERPSGRVLAEHPVGHVSFDHER